MSAPRTHFDRNKPFYPLVSNYCTQLLGLKELCLRGLLGPRELPSNDGAPPQFAKLSGPLELKCETSPNRIWVDPDEVAQDLVDNHTYLLPHYIVAAGSLLVLAHETTKNRTYRDNGPLWEFLFHCRNAVAHNGSFTFQNGQPKYPSHWAGIHIDTTFQGRELFIIDNNGGLLSVGDPIALLWDIEQAYPAISL